MIETIEAKWIEAFTRTFALCGIGPGDPCAILSETQSRAILVKLSELALVRLGARPFHITMVTPPEDAPVPVRSTGASRALGGLKQAVRALADSTVVIDCTVEGLLHAPERNDILANGARIMMISNEHPEVLERLAPDARLAPAVGAGVALIQSSRRMRVTSAAGTDLDVDITDAPARGSSGFVTEPGRIGYWPAGLCLCFPKAGTVNGRLVLAPGDANLTFKSYIQQPVALTIEDDRVTRIDGEGLDAELIRSYLAAWDERDAYATSHVGWGLNPKARWEALTAYDRADVNGTELRAFAGNFLFSTGANEHAQRFTRGHFDFPMRNCTVTLDGTVVVERGQVNWEAVGGYPF
jgi:2,5-dihydroxypyridine 5,6-dioxygenase